MQRYFYISNAFDEGVKRHRSITGDSPAASGKIISICRSVREQGGKATVVSLGRGRQGGSWKWHPAVIRRPEGVPIIYAAYFDAPLVTHIVSAFSMLMVLLRVARRNSVLIFYNYLAYYVPTLIVSRLLGRRCILDLEDGFRSDDRTWKGRLNLFLLTTYNIFCNGGAMLASSTLIDQTRLRPTIVCYGAATDVPCCKNWHESPLQVLFGGALFKDTGAELFLDTLNLLVTEHRDVLCKFKIVVTGAGDMAEKIKETVLAKYHGFVEFRGAVSRKEYMEILHESHIGMCLKMPDMSMGMTTFPSKVVEMAAFGLLVVSTKVSDVPFLFSDRTSVLLKNASPEDLASVLVDIAKLPEKYGDIAFQGHKELTELLSNQRVGAALLAFWKGQAPLQN